MDFQRKQVPFLHTGMNWNSPVEKLQDGQVTWAKNVRVLEQGTISAAHGMTTLFTGISASYLHSFSRLNILNEVSNADGSRTFDEKLGRTYVLGADKDLYIFQDQQTLGNPFINPVNTPLGQHHTFSGNPLSVVDAEPSGAAVAWKYIGDSKQMVTVGYYPTDRWNTNMARALTIGLDPPVNEPTTNRVHIGGTGNLLGSYQWCFAYRRVQTGARSNPSAASRATVKTPALALTNQHVTMRLPFPPNDPQTGNSDLDHVLVDVYRFGGVVFRWALVGSGRGGEVFTDNIQDLSILAAPAPSQTTDATTGLTRFNLYRPFITQDIAREGSGTLSQEPVSNVYMLTAPAGSFNPQWLAGSTIYVNATACTIYQVLSDTMLEIADDLGPATDANGNVTGTPVISPGPVTWHTNAGTLMAGQPLPHIWGPYGIGQSGSFIFACGDPNARGTLYWTNGNDPDSTDVVNNIVVTSPSEKLVTGCLYDGQPYVWSTERQFQIFPSLMIFGQFTTQELAGAKGVWHEWSLSTQSNGLADQSVTWRGKDGIYDWSGGQNLQRLSDPLYSFFPHDNNPGIAPESILPFININSHHPEHVGNLDDTQPKFHRLCWFQGLLYYDFPARADPLDVAVSFWSTLVWDSVNIPGGGWVSLDQPFTIQGQPDTQFPVCRAIDIGANDPNFDARTEPGPIFGPMVRGGSMKVLWAGPSTKPDGSLASAGTIYDYYGYTRGFESRFITRAEDIGDSRAQKRWGDYWLDCTPLNTFTVYPLAGFHRCAMQPVTVPGDQTAITPDFCPNPSEPGNRAQFILDFQEFIDKLGASLMSPTLGLDIIWTSADGQFAGSLNQWSPSYVLKPEVISFRASDPDDLGQLQAKYFTGFNMEANTFNQYLGLNVLIDQKLVSTLTILHDGQSEKPYAFTPTAGYETQLEMNAPQSVNGEPPTWQLYKLNWIFEPWPDATTRDSFFSDLGYTGSKFMQGMVVPMETGGNPVTFNVQGDCGQKATMGPTTTPNLCKMDVAFAFSPCNTYPSDVFIASQIQIQPNSAARIWYDQIKWIWEPEPELVPSWVTQPTDHDFPTWHHHRDCFIAYRGGNGTPTLYITTEYGTEAYPLDPVTPNQYVRCYRVLKPQKAKWRSYRVEGCGLFRLYIKDSVVRVKEWGSTQPYVNAQPFGDMSRVNGAPGGAKI